MPGYPEPDPKLHPGYYNAVATLARELAQELKELKKLQQAPVVASVGNPESAQVTAQIPPSSSTLTVFLAETGDDLIQQRRIEQCVPLCC